MIKIDAKELRLERERKTRGRRGLFILRAAFTDESQCLVELVIPP